MPPFGAGINIPLSFRGVSGAVSFIATDISDIIDPAINKNTGIDETVDKLIIISPETKNFLKFSFLKRLTANDLIVRFFISGSLISGNKLNFSSAIKTSSSSNKVNVSGFKADSLYESSS